MCRAQQSGPFQTVSHNISREGGVQEKTNSCLTSCELDRTYEGAGALSGLLCSRRCQAERLSSARQAGLRAVAGRGNCSGWVCTIDT